MGKFLLIGTCVLLTSLLLCVFVLAPLLLKSPHIIGFLERKIQETTQVSIHIENMSWNPFSSIKIKIKSFKVDLTNKKEEKELKSFHKFNIATYFIPLIKKTNIEIETFSLKTPSGNFSGRVSMESEFSKKSQQIHLKLINMANQITFESADGKIFIDKFKIEPQGSIIFDFKNANQIQVKLNIGFGGGEIVYKSFYANLKNTRFLARVQSQLRYDHDVLKIEFQNMELLFEEALLLKAQGEISPQGKLIQLNLSSRLQNLDGLKKIAQLTLSDTYVLLKELETEGEINFNININGKWADLSFTGELGVNKFSLNIPSKKIILKNTEVSLPFSFSQSTSREVASIEKSGKISFESLAKNNLSLNKISFHLNNTNNAISIKTPISIKILGGTLNIQKAHIQVFPSQDRHLEMAFSTQDLSFKNICDFLGLGKTKGTLNSKIDLLQLDHENLEIKGATKLQAWDGSVVVKNVNIAEPFGLVPTIKVSSIDINQVRLLPITEDLGFGIIDGTVNGYIRNLTVIEQKPISFNMEIKSVNSSNSSQVISVQAIKNITRLSGGDSGGFTNSFMFSLVNTFKYSHLGFRAHLDGDLLQLEPNYSSGTTAYLIKGSFFPPSVDVLYKNEVHKQIPLPELMERLKNIDWKKTYVK